MTNTLLPPNATALERAVASTTGRIDALPTPLRDVWSPADCPVDALPWLAWSFGVEDWSAEWSEKQRRAIIDQAIPVKRYRGTIGAVQLAINALGLSCRVQEWFNQIPAGDPYTYNLLLEVDQIGYSLPQLQQMLAMVERTKNLRSHLENMIPSAIARSSIYVSTVASTGSQLDINSGTPKYSNGIPAIDLLIDAAINGESSTVSAINALHHSLHTIMSAINYW